MSVRRLKDRFFAMAFGVIAVSTCALLMGILLVIVLRGIDAVSLEFLTAAPRAAGTAGGIAFQIIGTVILVGSAAAVSTPVSLGLSLVQTEYLKGTLAKKLMKLFVYTLNGVPSIIFGLFGFFLFVTVFGWGKSWLAGGIILGVMIIPTVAVAAQEAIEAIPRAEREAAIALGFNRPKVIWALVVPRSFRGLLTGSLLGLARAAGETAPIMFTAAVFAGAGFPTGVRESPVLALPYHILNLAQDSYRAESVRNAWGTALVLVSMVIIVSALAVPLRLRFHEEAQG